jgi:chemotaxis protein MotB
MAKEESSEDKASLMAPLSEEEECPAGSPAWMTTFADLVTLLMCFFVLLFAMSTTQQETYKELVQSLRSALGAQAIPEAGTREGLQMHAVPSEEPTETPQIDELGGLIQKEMDEIISEVRELVMFNKLGGMVSVTQTETGVVITMTDMLLFKKGGATLAPKGLDILEKVAFVLAKFAYHIRIRGHTDSIPMRSARYPSNWELSGARAGAVVRLLVKHGVDPNLVSAEGYAGYHPVATNDTEEGRAQNRRVEIVYERDSIARQFADMKVSK